MHQGTGFAAFSRIIEINLCPRTERPLQGRLVSPHVVLDGQSRAERLMGVQMYTYGDLAPQTCRRTGFPP